MGFIDNDRIIGTQIPIALGFGQQDAVGHDFNVGVFWGSVLKTNFVTNGPTGLLPQFFSDPAGNRCRCNSPGLGASNQAVDSPTGGQTILRQLGGFTGTGLPGNHDDRMPLDGLNNFIFSSKNRQFFVKPQRRQICPAVLSLKA